MKAVEFEGTVTPNGQIAVPAEIAEQLPPGEPLHIVLRWNAATDEDGVWRTQGGLVSRSNRSVRQDVQTGLVHSSTMGRLPRGVRTPLRPSADRRAPNPRWTPENRPLMDTSKGTQCRGGGFWG